MFEKTLVVKYITSKDSFVYLSDRVSKSVKQGSVVKLAFKNGKSLHFSAGPPQTGLNDEEIAVSSAYAKHLELHEGDYVELSLCGSVPGIKCLDVTPETEDDLEILESMREIIQETLLNQIRVVSREQKMLVWIGSSLHIIITIGNIEPASPGRLDNLTELIVKPPAIRPKKRNGKVTSSWNMEGFIKHLKQTKITKTHILSKYNTSSHLPLLFRLQPVDDVKDKIPQFQAKAFFKVYVDEDSLSASYLEEGMSSLKIVIHSGDHNFFDETSPVLESIAVQVCPVKNLWPQTHALFVPLFVNKCLFAHYNVKLGTKAILSKLAEITSVTAIEVGTTQKFLNDVQNKFKAYLAETCNENQKLLLNSNFALDITGDCTVKLRFSPMNIKAVLIDGDCKLTSFECDLSSDVMERGSVSSVNLCCGFSSFQKVLNDCVRCYNICGENQNILIVGKAGTGKSVLASEFADVVSCRHHAYADVIACKSMKGKSLDSLHKLFNSAFSRLIYYQPSVLVLDDLHVLCEKVADGDAPTQESIHFNKASELLADLLEQYLADNMIFVLATAESTAKLNRHVFASRGKHLFKNTFIIEDINKAERRAILEEMFSQTVEKLEGIDAEELALKTEGFVIQDLHDFVGKCVFEAYKEESLNITSNHCVSALRNTPSLALRDVKLHSPGDRDFCDVGGLEDVKKILVECMLWPAQYSNIFAKSPLRLQSGLLLYGPPGTGKTILAGAAAKQCGLRLISVKGPELLSKYIGASEQAVRDIFQKAQSAKPCILFFDEFDSLAPRRGHDNTGVTDRVVNQFLTQLDGVEALVGVSVLAATSRPDLLDPALLRPGRLDRQILCPLPDQASRLAILKTLSRNLAFEEDVNLEKIAEDTRGFSGADLQAVLYTAQLASVEFLLDEDAAAAASDLNKESTINQAGLEEAVRNTRPSLTVEEKRKYERIYARFQEKTNVDDIIKGRQRATLA